MFIPSHCPNPDCTHYFSIPKARWYRKIASYKTKTFGQVPRFLCKSCHRSFSSQTFSIDYYAKKQLRYQSIYNQINAGSGLRNIARNFHVSPRTIRNRINRLARNAIIIHESLLHHLPFDEDFVADGFESFCVSQYFPDNYHILVGKSSQFVYQWNYVTLRRKGRMRDDQRKRRADLEKRFRASPGGIKASFGELMGFLDVRTQSRSTPLILYTDEKKDYQRALWYRGDLKERLYSGSWRHHMVNSKLTRNTQNPLFSVNYIDREFRKDMASHARESLQFSRNVNEAMMRMSLYIFDHNYLKPFRVADRVKKRYRHAQMAGLDREVLEDSLSGFFTDRRFWRRGESLDGPGRRSLERGWVTPLKKGPEKRWKHMAA
jgi:transposase-like protein